MSKKQVKKPVVKKLSAALQAVFNSAVAEIAGGFTATLQATSADGRVMLAFHALHRSGLQCAPALDAALKIIPEDNRDVLKSRKTKAFAIAKAVDAGAVIQLKDGTQSSVGMMLAHPRKDGTLAPASLQGLYPKLNPAAPKSVTELRDSVTDSILKAMLKPEAQGGGRWVAEKAHVAHLLAEFDAKKAEITAELRKLEAANKAAE